MDMAFEEWRSISIFDGFYAVSNLGRVKSLARTICRPGGKPRNLPERLMRGTIGKRGYLIVSLRKPGQKQIKRPIHQLVACAFLPPREGANEVNHVNGIKIQNNVLNLEWNTHAENMAHAWDNGLTPRPRKSAHAR